MYLGNILAHWPAEGPSLAGFCQRHGLPVRKAAIRRPLKARSLRLRPLRDLIGSYRPDRQLPYLLERPLLKAYAAAFNRCLRRGNWNVYFEPNNLPIPTARPTVATVHDLSVLEHPQWHPKSRVARWEARLSHGLTDIGRWISPSQFTRQRMVDVLGLRASQITVIALASRPLPYPERSDAAEAVSQARLPPNYLLHLGSIEPRKNIAMLLDAYAALSPAVRSACKLILAGPIGWGDKAFWTTLHRHRAAAEVLATGYVSDRHAAVLLAGARALVAPSAYEGFGLPMLEAMACGTAVLCSTAGALQEVAGGAACVIAAQDVPAWTAAMHRAAAETEWLGQLAKSGLERAGQFSWQAAADGHAAVMTGAFVDAFS